MFDLGFWELLFVGVIALVVLGPERLPVAARTVGRWVGQARSYARSLSNELDREVHIKEIRQQVQSAETEIRSGFQSADQEVRALATHEEKTTGTETVSPGAEAAPAVEDQTPDATGDASSEADSPADRR
ncbi:MAG: Sec-independent protein translocase protein TatB [Algiphilus sp.]